MWIDKWLADGCSETNWCSGADIDHSNDVDLDDFALLAQNWRVVEPYIATGHDSRIDLRWLPVDLPGLQGYNIYRAASPGGPFIKQNSSLYKLTVYSDFIGTNDQTYHYYIASVAGGVESEFSPVLSATSYAMTDEELTISVQEAAFRYFWDYAHPVSGMAREGYNFGHNLNTCASGGTGMGLMAICVGAERGFVSRAQAAKRVLKILTFLDEDATRYHGAWSLWINGSTGATIPFGTVLPSS